MSTLIAGKAVITRDDDTAKKTLLPSEIEAINQAQYACSTRVEFVLNSCSYLISSLGYSTPFIFSTVFTVFAPMQEDARAPGVVLDQTGV